MSSYVPDEPRLEVSQPKIEVVKNAKGSVQWEIQVVPGVTSEEMDELRKIAVAQWNALEAELPDLPR